MLTIRLARFGKKKQPFYRVVVNEKKNPPKSKVVEYLGTYNPKSKELKYDKDRITHWLGLGAGYSQTVGMILVKEGFIKKEDMPAVYNVEKKRKPKKEVPEEQPKAPVVPAEPAVVETAEAAK
jgi:small subunit ribosomal protein S16